MRPELAKTAIILIFSWLQNGAAGNSVEQKIYVELNHTVPCVRLLNATHQIGCQSSISGDTGVIHVLEAESDVDWVLSSGPNPPYMVLMEANFFNRAIMMRMKGSPRVAGVAVVIPKSGPPQGFSPHNSCPNEGTGVYSDSYGPELAGCNSTVWNPLGNSLSYENFNFPVFSLNDDNETEVIRKCFREHNVVRNGSSPQFPLCAMQLYSHMHAATDTVTCMRRNNIQNSFSVTPEVVCDAINDYNVWGSVHPLNNSAKGHKEGESVVIAAARIDGRSFFWDVAPSAEGAVAGFVTLLAAAHALRRVTVEAPPTRNILFTFFQGETFDYIGSSRMVYDMENGKFVINLDNIHSLLEIGQVGLRSGSRLWLHSDPVSRRRNSSVDAEVEKLVSNLQSVAKNLSLSLAEPNVSQPLPPSSFQRFLRARPIPGVVLADHQSAFNNRYYESVYDTAEHLQVTYPPGLSPEEQLEYVTDVAKDLAEVATLVARSLYLQANGSEANLPSITADPMTVTQMLYGFLVQSNNSWFQALTSPDGFTLEPHPLQYYVGVSGPPRPIKVTTRLVQYVLANLTGTATNLTQSQCQNPENLEGENKELWSYLWVRGSVSSNSSQGEAYCVRASVRLSKAVSPAFELQDYGSRDYSTWTESRWKLIRARIFLVASRELEMLTLGVGVAVLLVSLLVTYFISSKADLLFTSSREPTSTTY